MNPKFGQNFQYYNSEQNPQTKGFPRRSFEQNAGNPTDFVREPFLPIPPPPPPRPTSLLPSKTAPVGLIPFLSSLNLSFWSGFVFGMVFAWVNVIVLWCVVDAFYFS